jgi:S1-C subfamily serine protease
VVSVDAVPDPAADGAPLLDSSGRVIGVVVASPSTGPPGLLALSGRAASDLVSRLGRGGRRAIDLGIETVILDPASAAAVGTRPGALVRAVTPGGPGESAGLLVGDVITAIGGSPVDADHPLTATAFGLVSGQRVTMTVVRGTDERSVVLTVG